MAHDMAHVIYETAKAEAAKDKEDFMTRLFLNQFDLQLMVVVDETVDTEDNDGYEHTKMALTNSILISVVDDNAYYIVTAKHDSRNDGHIMRYINLSKNPQMVDTIVKKWNIPYVTTFDVDSPKYATGGDTKFAIQISKCDEYNDYGNKKMWLNSESIEEFCFGNKITGEDLASCIEFIKALNYPPKTMTKVTW